MIEKLRTLIKPLADAASGPTAEFADTLEASKAAIAQALRDAKNGTAGAAQPAAAPAGAQMEFDSDGEAAPQAQLAATEERLAAAERRAAELEKCLAAERKAREAAERKALDAAACTVAEGKRADYLESELRTADRGYQALQSLFSEERKRRRAAEKALQEAQARPASTSLVGRSGGALAAAPQRAVPRPAPCRSRSRERTPPPPPRAGPAELRGKRKPPDSANPPTPDPGQPPATVEFDFTETFDGGGPAGEAERRGSDQRRRATKKSCAPGDGQSYEQT